jgi:hypothetical protein
MRPRAAVTGTAGGRARGMSCSSAQRPRRQSALVSSACRSCCGAESWRVNRKRAYRLYRQEGLIAVPTTSEKASHVEIAQPSARGARHERMLGDGFCERSAVAPVVWTGKGVPVIGFEPRCVKNLFRPVGRTHPDPFVVGARDPRHARGAQNAFYGRPFHRYAAFSACRSRSTSIRRPDSRGLTIGL